MKWNKINRILIFYASKCMQASFGRDFNHQICLYSTLVNESWLELWVITVMLIIKMIIN